MARAFRDQLRADEAVLADLDAIGGGEPAWSVFEGQAGAEAFVCGWMPACASGPSRRRWPERRRRRRARPGDGRRGRRCWSAVCAGCRPARRLLARPARRPTAGRPARLAASRRLVDRGRGGWPWRAAAARARPGARRRRRAERDTEAVRSAGRTYPRSTLYAGGGVRGVEDLRRLEGCGVEGGAGRVGAARRSADAVRMSTAYDARHS